MIRPPASVAQSIWEQSEKCKSRILGSLNYAQPGFDPG
jgi:hypothetical protein